MATRKSIKPALSAIPKGDFPHLTPMNVEELQRKLNHLTIALWLCSSSPGGFDELAENDKRDYLCMLADMAADARGAAGHMLIGGKEAANV